MEKQLGSLCLDEDSGVRAWRAEPVWQGSHSGHSSRDKTRLVPGALVFTLISSEQLGWDLGVGVHQASSESPESAHLPGVLIPQVSLKFTGPAGSKTFVLH